MLVRRFRLWRRLVALLPVVLLSASLFLPAVTRAEEKPVRVFVDGQEVAFDVPPAVIGGRTLVPLRAIFTALGATVDWNGATRTVTGTLGQTSVQLTVGNSDAFANGRGIHLDVPPTIVDGRTLVPLRFISEALGATVGWYGQARIDSVSRAEPAARGAFWEPIDGATLMVQSGPNGTTQVVRLIGVDPAAAPQVAAMMSAYANLRLVEDPALPSPAGTHMAYAFLDDGRMVNAALAEAGYGQQEPLPAGLMFGPLLEALSADAKLAGRGLWGSARPTAPAYKAATTRPTGSFKSGQPADLVLSAFGFNNSGGASAMNEPSRVATDGKRLAVTDTRNNRVLIWNSIPTASSQPADLALGQPDLVSNNAGLGPSGMNFPVGVSTDGTRLVVTDAYNERILIWNQWPARSGQPADVVVGAPDFETWPPALDSQGKRDNTRRVFWPWDAMIAGGKLIATSVSDGAVLIWNSVPTQNYQPADLILGFDSFEDRGIRPPTNPLERLATPRAIASDGQHLIVSDYNAETNYVWNTFPTRNGQPADFTFRVRRYDRDYHEMNEQGTLSWGLFMQGGRLFATDSVHILIFNTVPTAAPVKADLALGSFFLREEGSLGAGKLGGAYGVTTDGQRLIVADTHNDRVLIWNRIPTDPRAPADIVLGQPDFQTDQMLSRALTLNPAPFSDGQHLFAGSDTGLATLYWNRIPDESGAPADLLLPAAKGITSDGTHYYLLGRWPNPALMIWNGPPKSGLPDRTVLLGGRMDNPWSMTTDGTALYVADGDRILVWRQVPERDGVLPDYILGQGDDPALRISTASQVSADASHLAVSDQYNHRVLIWNLPISRTGQAPDVVLKQMPAGANGMNLPGGVTLGGGRLFVADGGNARVLGWNSVPTKSDTPPDFVLGQKDFAGSYSAFGQSGFLVPMTLSYDGAYLWVGEFKWSSRILRFSPR